VEPNTPLNKLIKEKKKEPVDSEKQAAQFLQLMQWLEDAGYEHYEISNFAKQGYRSRHNAAYWLGKKYLGLGPSANSFDGDSRQWNVANNAVYIRSLKENEIPFEKEVLSLSQKINEYIMTSLRTMEGLDINRIRRQYPEFNPGEILRISRQFIASGKMELKNERLVLTKQGKLFADGIAAELFL
jgi:oxygen-independent coproporphyrinogen-3 oxidase